jgi:hypothetical protein
MRWRPIVHSALSIGLEEGIGRGIVAIVLELALHALLGFSPAAVELLHFQSLTMQSEGFLLRTAEQQGQTVPILVRLLRRSAAAWRRIGEASKPISVSAATSNELRLAGDGDRGHRLAHIQR